MIELPRELAEGVERLLQDVHPRDLARASTVLSDKYRQKQERQAPVARSQAEILAYAAVRLPATYAAVSAALGAVREIRPDWQPRTVLDLGAGPGTATWSAAVTWPSLERATAVEAEARMIALGQNLGRSAQLAAVRDAVWVQGSVTDVVPDGPFDLVILAYVLGELDSAGRDRAIDRTASVTTAPSGLTVVVEPGTPEGYIRVIRARERLVASGGFVTAPCPHDLPCPMLGSDWCHFAVRLPRTVAHRAAKQADLGYEDEKYSYVAVSQKQTARTAARVVRHPQTRPRLVRLELCTLTGLQSAIVTRSDRDGYRRARKIDWGESFADAAPPATDNLQTSDG